MVTSITGSAAFGVGGVPAFCAPLDGRLRYPRAQRRSTLTEKVIRTYGMHVTNREHWHRDILASGLIGIGFLLNVDNVAGLLAQPLPPDRAAQATVAAVLVYWVLWLAVAVRLLRLPRSHT